MGWLPAACLASCLAVIVWPLPVAGDAPQARIVGTVIHHDRGAGIPGVVVSLTDPVRLRITDAHGRFLFDGVEAGVYSLTVEHLGFRAVTETVRVERPDTTVELEIRLVPEAIRLEPLIVEFWRSPILVEVRERRDWMARVGLGSSFDRGAVEASGAIRVSHLLARLPGVRIRPIPGRVGGTIIRLSPRVNCDPSVYINGIRTPLAGASLDDLVAIGEVESIEVFRRLSALPGEFADERARSCGAVVIFTRRWVESPGEFGWRRMVSLTAFLSIGYAFIALW